MSQVNLRRHTSILLALLVLLAGCRGASPAAISEQASGAAGAGNSQTGTIAVSGAFALYPLMVAWADAYQATHPGVRIDVSAGGAGKGMADTLAGAVDIGMVSRDITPEEEAKGAFWVPVTKDAVFLTASAANPYLETLMKQGVSPEALAGMFASGTLKTWDQVTGKPGDSQEIHVYTRSDASGAAEIWGKLLGVRQEDLLGIGVFGDPGILEAVIKDPLGIGYNNLNYAYDQASGNVVAGAAVLPVDFNRNGLADPDEVMATKAAAVSAVSSGRYPSPPARNLNLVTRGKPSGLVQAFIAWIVTEGQQYVDATGYVQLPASQLQAAAEKVR